MYEVRIINNQAILFEDDNQVENLEQYRNECNNIRYKFHDGSYINIRSDNAIIWHDYYGEYHREGDMPAFIYTNGHMEYWKHGKLYRIGGPAVIWSNGSVEYWLDDIEYTKDAYINKINSNYGCISGIIT